MLDRLTVDYRHLKSQIIGQGYATVPFPLERQRIERAVELFMRFALLPYEFTSSVYFKVDPNNRGTEVGFRRRRQDWGDLDNREYFHYNEHVDRFAGAAAGCAELKEFLAAASEIYSTAGDSLACVLRACETEFPDLREKFFQPGFKPEFYLRFLKYDRAASGDFLAKGHYDRGGCTLAIAESAPGLRLGRDDRDLREVRHRPGEAFFMPGIKFFRHTSDQFAPVWHDVRQRGENFYRDDVARWAVVFFADAPDDNITTFEEAHTPIYHR